MSLKKNFLYIIIVLLVSHALVYYISLKFERYKNVNIFNDEIEKYEIDMIRMHYKNYKDIYFDIKENKVDSAKCKVELAASSLLESIDYCKDSSFCTDYLETQDKVIAPELLGKAPKVFEKKNSCSP